ncbi:MAG: hypothetical protein IIA44_11625 [Acidobacteria bacterium]|nr:hypothetical protein [Acidobacteriota bacterium]
MGDVNKTTFTDLEVTGNLDVAGDLNLTGDLVLDDVTVGGILTVAGLADLNGALEVAGASTLAALDVSGELDLSGADEGIPLVFCFTLPGDLVVGDSEVVFSTPFAGMTLVKAEAHAKTAPTDADAIIDIAVGAVDVATLTITAGTKKAEDITIDAAGAGLALATDIDIDITQKGSTIAGADVDVILTVRNVGDAAILWWDIMNLSDEPRALGMLYGSWVAMHTGLGQIDSQSGANIFFMIRGTNFGINKLTQDLFTGYAVTGTTRAIRNDHNLRRTSTRFPDKIAFYAGQTEAYGLLATMVPDETQRKLSPDPLDARFFLGATTADRVRIGNYLSGDGRGGTLWDNVMVMDVFADATGLQEEADIIITEHSYIQRFPVQQVSPGGFRRIIQVIRSTWGVSDYNDPYTAVLDAPRLVNADPNGVDGLSPNPMRIRAYLDNQYAKLDQEVTMQNVRFIIELPDGTRAARTSYVKV